MLKILALTANLSHISRVQKPGLRPTALAFLYPKPGQKPAQAKGWARLGPAFFGLAWPGFWPQAGAGTSLITIMITTTTKYTATTFHLPVCFTLVPLSASPLLHISHRPGTHDPTASYAECFSQAICSPRPGRPHFLCPFQNAILSANSAFEHRFD